MGFISNLFQGIKYVYRSVFFEKVTYNENILWNYMKTQFLTIIGLSSLYSYLDLPGYNIFTTLSDFYLAFISSLCFLCLNTFYLTKRYILLRKDNDTLDQLIRVLFHYNLYSFLESFLLTLISIYTNRWIYKIICIYFYGKLITEYHLALSNIPIKDYTYYLRHLIGYRIGLGFGMMIILTFTEQWLYYFGFLERDILILLKFSLHIFVYNLISHFRKIPLLESFSFDIGYPCLDILYDLSGNIIKHIIKNPPKIKILRPRYIIPLIKKKPFCYLISIYKTNIINTIDDLIMCLKFRYIPGVDRIIVWKTDTELIPKILDRLNIKDMEEIREEIISVKDYFFDMVSNTPLTKSPNIIVEERDNEIFLREEYR